MAEALFTKSVATGEKQPSPAVPSPSIPQEADCAVEVTEFFESLHPFFGQALLYIILVFVAATLIWTGLGEVDVVADHAVLAALLGSDIAGDHGTCIDPYAHADLGQASAGVVAVNV